MNKSITSIFALLALCAATAMAVPSGINYQGALTDDQGNPITGTRTMSIKLYDAATGGTLLYTEDIGAVDVSDGVFSFEFGTGGTSNAEQSDTLAITDGKATSFQKVLSAAEVVAGSVSVTDGTYTWSQSSGSSNEDDFSVVYSTNLRRVTVTYLSGAPAAGRTIAVTYRSPASGISGALAGDNQPWAEITVDGVAQVPRQKVLTVPFAAKSALAENASLFGGLGAENFVKGLGGSTSVSPMEVHRAPRDGIVTVLVATRAGACIVRAGETNPPTVVRGQFYSFYNATGTINVFVRAGEYYRIEVNGPTSTSNGEFIDIGTPQFVPFER
jgi:hypothetical protein